MKDFMKIRLVSLILGFLACLPLASGADHEVQVRFEKSLKVAKTISNVQIEWLDTLWINDPAALMALNATVFSRTFEYSFIASGQKFRASCKLISGTSTNMTRLCESAFDGESYTTYTADSRSMTKRTLPELGSNSESADNPLAAPFMFLGKRSDDCGNCVLRSTDIASDGFARGLTLPTGQRADGLLEISLTGLPVGKKPTTWTIAIDEASDTFSPRTIRFVAPGSGYEVDSKLLDYTNLGAYPFPTRIEWSMSAFPPTSPPTLLSTGMVSVISARIPDRTTDSVFNLDSEEQTAATVWDWDQKTLTKSGPRSEDCLRELRLKEAARQQASTNAQSAITNRLMPPP